MISKKQIIFSIILFLIDKISCSTPILNSDNPLAVPIQNFDFVFIPKEVVQSHLPAFERRKLRLKANCIAKELNIFPPAPTDSASQLKLLEWYKRKKLAEKDPKGMKRKYLNRELCRLNSLLDFLVLKRRNIISDVARVKISIQECNSRVKSSSNSEYRYIECKAIKEHFTRLSTELRQMNLKEREILLRIAIIRKEFTLF